MSTSAPPSRQEADAASVAARDRLGRPLHSLRLSVTDRCNLRCSYCMPEESYRWLPRTELLDFAELERVVAAFTDVGVHKLRITGGEPLLRRELPLLLERLCRNPQLDDIGLTTNGIALPQHAQALRDAGLQRLTVSLDTLSADRFRALTRRDALADVLAGIEAAATAGFVGRKANGEARLKLDTVLLRGVNHDEVDALLAFAEQCGAELRFIEYMDVGGATQWQANKVVTRSALLASLSERHGTPVPTGQRGAAPAERFRLPDGRVFGIIGSTSAPFCGACDRSRVTADGMWFHCLYAQRGLDLKQRLRGGESDIPAFLRSCWAQRDDRGAELRQAVGDRGSFVPLSALRGDPHLEMHTRGG